MNMKNIIKSTIKIVTTLLAFSALIIMSACNDNPDEYVITAGNPTVDYIRLPDVTKSDSLLTHAFMGTTIALIGQNLTSVKEVWFNDQMAILNTSLITSTALIVPVTSVIPTKVTNKIYLVSSSGDTVKVDFGVDVPAPIVSSMKCEQVAVGVTAVIRGDFFLDDPNIPLQVIFPGNIPATDIVSIAKTEITVIVPEGATIPGQINVKSLYGNGRSSFWFLDNRGMILDFDNTNANGGWRSGKLASTNPDGISGNYVRFSGKMLAASAATWDEDSFSFDLWGIANGRPQGDLFSTEPSQSSIKFEVNVDKAWASGALQMIFTPWSTNGTNSYIPDATVPRGLWIPWKDAGTYMTDGWETVTIPLSQFKYTADGKVLAMPSPGNYGSLTFFVYGGGITGSDCTPDICIDNIRVVPNN
jgi:hypothetical protein